MEIIERSQDWKVCMEGARLEMVQVDYRLVLKLSAGNDLGEICIETSTEMSDPQGLTANLEPEDATTLCPVVSLVKSKIDEIVIRKDGVLSVHFTSGNRLRTPPNDDYEAWQISCKSFLVVCPPGGGVTIFRDPAGKRTC